MIVQVNIKSKNGNILTARIEFKKEEFDCTSESDPDFLNEIKDYISAGPEWLDYVIAEEFESFEIEQVIKCQ